MRDGFKIDLDTVEHTRRALIRLAAEVDAKPIQDLDAPASAYGHGELARVTAAFADAWQKSTDQYLQEISDIIDGLEETAKTYHELERNIAAAFCREEG